MRQMSFSLTTPQCRNKSKTQTRRLGWRHATPGMLLQQIEKGQGLRKGETVTKIHVIRVLSVRREPLRRISASDVVAEGFPNMTPAAFVAMFCQHNQVRPSTVITRIAFEYVEERTDMPKEMAMVVWDLSSGDKSRVYDRGALFEDFGEMVQAMRTELDKGRRVLVTRVLLTIEEWESLSEIDGDTLDELL